MLTGNHLDQLTKQIDLIIETSKTSTNNLAAAILSLRKPETLKTNLFGYLKILVLVVLLILLVGIGLRNLL